MRRFIPAVLLCAVLAGCAEKPHALQAARGLETPELRLREIVTGLGMKYMDAGAEMRRRGDTERFYTFGSYGGHLSDAGNAVLADMILQAAGKPPEQSR